MKLYILDLGWAGAKIIVAESKEHAYEIYKQNAHGKPYDFKDFEPEEHDIVVGLHVETVGDV